MTSREHTGSDLSVDHWATMDRPIFSRINAANGRSSWCVLLVDGNRSFEGHVVDVKTAELAAVFGRSDAPRLRIAEHVALSLVNARGMQRIACHVTAQSHQDNDRVVYEFKLDGRSRMDLTELFCERRDVRVRPNPSTPVEVLVSAAGVGEVRTVLYDISRSGLAVLVRADDEEKLFRVDWVFCRFQLPPDDHWLEVEGSVRNRQLLGAAIRYGIQFKPTEQSEAESEELVRAYVMRRQVEIIRHTRERSA